MKNFSRKKNSTLYVAVIILAVVAMLVVFYTVDRKSTNSLESKMGPPQDAAAALNSIPIPQGKPYSGLVADLGNGRRLWL